MKFCENFMPRWKQTRKQISHQVPHWHVFELVYEASARKGLGYFPLSEAKKRNRFFSNLTKLHSNIQPNVLMIKAPELFRKTYFQIKVKKSGRWKLKSDGHSWKLFVYGKIFAHGKIKSERESRVKKKKKKKTGLKEKERPQVSQEKKTIPSWRRLLPG